MLVSHKIFWMQKGEKRRSKIDKKPMSIYKERKNEYPPSENLNINPAHAD